MLKPKELKKFFKTNFSNDILNIFDQFELDQLNEIKKQKSKFKKRRI